MSQCIFQMLFFYCFCNDNKLCCIIFFCLLNHSCNTYFMHSEYTCNCSKYTWFIIHQHTDIELVLYFFKVLYRCLTITGTTDSSCTMVLYITDYIDHITHDRTGRREFPCSSSVEHRITGSIRADKYCIKRISHGCKRMFLRNHHRMNSNLNSFFRIMCNTE